MSEDLCTTNPNYDIACVVCGQKPTVDIVDASGRIDHTELCGSCCFGEADCADPDNW